MLRRSGRSATEVDSATAPGFPAAHAGSEGCQMQLHDGAQLGLVVVPARPAGERLSIVFIENKRICYFRTAAHREQFRHSTSPGRQSRPPKCDGMLQNSISAQPARPRRHRRPSHHKAVFTRRAAISDMQTASITHVMNARHSAGLHTAANATTVYVLPACTHAREKSG